MQSAQSVYNSELAKVESTQKYNYFRNQALFRIFGVFFENANFG